MRTNDNGIKESMWLYLRVIIIQLEQGTKDSYKEAMESVLSKIYDNYKVNLNDLKAGNTNSGNDIYDLLYNGGYATKAQEKEIKALEKEAIQKGLKNTLENLKAEPMPKDINIDEFFKTLDNFKNKDNFVEHLSNRTDSQARLQYLNLVEPTFNKPDFKFNVKDNGIQKEKRIKKFTDGKDFTIY